MGAVDLVIQVESPPSIAAGLQRVGRAQHHVGGIPKGVTLPKFTADVIASAVAHKAMREGDIESTKAPNNPLDILAQQIVAMVAMDDWPGPRLVSIGYSIDPIQDVEPFPIRFCLGYAQRTISIR